MANILMLPIGMLATLIAFRLGDEGITSPLSALAAFVALFASLFLFVQFREFTASLLWQKDFNFTENLPLKLILSAAGAIGFVVIWWVMA